MLVLIALTLFSGNAHALSCDDHEILKPGTKNNPDTLSFILPDGRSIKYRLKSREHQALSPEIAKTLSQYPEVKVLNPSNDASLYFMPYADTGIKGIKPAIDFQEARANHRVAGPGCSILNLKGQETITILSGSIAKWADQLTDVQVKAGEDAMNESQLEKYVEAVKNLNHGLGRESGVNRSPPTEQPTYADSVSTLKEKILDPPESIDSNGNHIPKKSNLAHDAN